MFLACRRSASLGRAGRNSQRSNGLPMQSSAFAFLHDIDKDLDLPRGAKIDVADVEETNAPIRD